MNVLRSTPPNAAISVYAASASSARLSTEPSETRRNLTSGCCSTPSVLLSESRTLSRSTCWSSRASRIPLGSAASWRYAHGCGEGVVAERAAGDRDRPGVVEHGDGQSEELGLVARSSRRRWRPPRPWRSRRSRPCHRIGARRDRSRCRSGRCRRRRAGATPPRDLQRPRRAGRSFPARPARRRVARPAGRRRGRRSRRRRVAGRAPRPARSSSVTNPSCSTSSSRLSRAVRCAPRYHTSRHSVASSWASHASRP